MITKRVIGISTAIGIVLVAVAISIYILPMFIDVKKDYTDEWYVPFVFGIIGLGLIGAPDKLFGSLGNLFKRKSEEL